MPRCGSSPRRASTPWSRPTGVLRPHLPSPRASWTGRGPSCDGRCAAPELAGDEPVLVLEPSCAATLRLDLRELLPDNPAAASLARRVTTFAELLETAGWVPPAGEPLEALVQPHCHQQAVLGIAADRRLMAAAGIEPTQVLQGCCGLAGNFGAEAGHERISRDVAELALLPALRATGEGTEILADGFSCRTQVAFLDGRRARHVAEVLAERLDATGSETSHTTGASAPRTRST